MHFLMRAKLWRRNIPCSNIATRRRQSPLGLDLLTIDFAVAIAYQNRCRSIRVNRCRSCGNVKPTKPIRTQP